MSMKDYSAELLKMEGVQIEKLDETEKEIGTVKSYAQKQQRHL